MVLPWHCERQLEPLREIIAKYREAWDLLRGEDEEITIQACGAEVVAGAARQADADVAYVE